MVETKLLVSSTISDAPKGARFMTADLKDYFLATAMECNEYLRVKMKYFPPDIIQRYHPLSLVGSDCYVYIKIQKGVYRLKQAALLAYNNLKKTLQPCILGAPNNNQESFVSVLTTLVSNTSRRLMLNISWTA